MNAAPHRIVVVLQAPRFSKVSFEPVLRIARRTEARVEGVFVEDTRLLEVAAHPFACFVHSRSHEPSAMDERLVRRQIPLDKLGARHVEMLGDPCGIFLADLDVHRVAAVGTPGAIDDVEGLLMQLSGKFVWIEAVVPKLEASEEFIVLIVVRLRIAPPLFDHGVMVHCVCLPADR